MNKEALLTPLTQIIMKRNLLFEFCKMASDEDSKYRGIPYYGPGYCMVVIFFGGHRPIWDDVQSPTVERNFENFVQDLQSFKTRLVLDSMNVLEVWQAFYVFIATLYCATKCWEYLLLNDGDMSQVQFLHKIELSEKVLYFSSVPWQISTII